MNRADPQTARAAPTVQSRASGMALGRAVPIAPSRTSPTPARAVPVAQPWSITRGVPRTWSQGPGPTIVPLRPRPFIFQNLRRNICPHFFLTGPRGTMPVHAPHLLKGLVRQQQNTSRCQLRAGVHLEEGYVLDVCLSARFNQCVFYEDDISRADERPA